MSPAVPPLLTMMRSRHRPLLEYGHTLHGDTLGSDNGARSVVAYAPTGFRYAAPESIHLPRRHRASTTPGSLSLACQATSLVHSLLLFADSLPVYRCGQGAGCYLRLYTASTTNVVVAGGFSEREPPCLFVPL